MIYRLQINIEEKASIKFEGIYKGVLVFEATNIISTLWYIYVDSSRNSVTVYVLFISTKFTILSHNILMLGKSLIAELCKTEWPKRQLLSVIDIFISTCVDIKSRFLLIIHGILDTTYKVYVSNLQFFMATSLAKWFKWIIFIVLFILFLWILKMSQKWLKALVITRILEKLSTR